jgi:hypothetical protein
MRLPPGIADYLVPRDFPPAQFVPRYALESYERIPGELSRRSYLWASAINRAALQALPARCSHVSAGFVYVDPDVLRGSKWEDRAVESFLFGAYALVEDRAEPGSQRLQSLEFGDVPFPMVMTSGSIDEQQALSQPAGGSAACWVKSKNSAAGWTHGILTCRHILSSSPLGARVTLDITHGQNLVSYGRLVEMTECTIDAAVIGIGSADWHASQPLQVHAPTAPNDDVRFAGRVTSTAGKVLRVFTDSSYYGNFFGQRIVTDCYGVHGDSGALVVDQHRAEGVALIKGTIPDGSKIGGKEGIHQDLRQAVEYFGLDLYQ